MAGRPPADDVTAMVRAEKLTKRYGGRTVLDRLDFEIGRGERVAILGANGAGKTTLFRCILGLAGFDGTLTVDGLEAGPGAREVRARMAWVPQLPPVYDLTLAGFLRLFSELRGIQLAHVEEHLGQLGLSLVEAGELPLRALSGGTLQKAYLGLALAAHASVLLLDEPTASLDPASRQDLLRTLAGVNGDTTILLASHRLEEIGPLAERILVVDGGRIAFDGPLSSLLCRDLAEPSGWLSRNPERGYPQPHPEPADRRTRLFQSLGPRLARA